jgi:hypothetical protein
LLAKAEKRETTSKKTVKTLLARGLDGIIETRSQEKKRLLSGFDDEAPGG